MGVKRKGDSATDRRALENLLLDDSEFARLETVSEQFNVFEALGMVSQEVRHSDFLAFLLDPRANHGLGDKFAKELLQRKLRLLNEDLKASALEAVELNLLDLSRMKVAREQEHVDILLIDEENQLAIVIENKVHATEREGQLQRYYEFVGREYPGWRHLFLFLTPGGEEPSHPAYLAMDYGLVRETVDVLLNQQHAIDQGLALTLAHYSTMLGRQGYE